MKPRPPQLTLLLDARTPDPAARWRDGATIACLGASLTLCLDTARKDAVLDGTVLHLPLPPEATPRQIQDRAEAWLREQAARVIGAQLVIEARRLGRPAPGIALSFAARAGWAQTDGKGGLRFHWRLVEQPAEIIEQVVRRALAVLPAPTPATDLFAAAA